VTRLLSRLRSDERGIALVMALFVLIALAIATTAVVQFTGSNARSSSIDTSREGADDIAVAAVQEAYSVLNKWDFTTGTGNNATDPTLLGCNAGQNGSSGTTCTPVCVSISATCPNSSSQGVAGTGTYVGSYNANTAIWSITGIGYARNPTGATVLQHSVAATVNIWADTNTPSNVAAWNHVFSTAPQGSGCEVDVNGQNVFIDVPVYVTGDLCLSGNNAAIYESSGGQPVDVRVVGKLVLSGASSTVGRDASHPITSGSVGQGCTTSISGTPQPCQSPPFNYYVRNTTPLQTLTPPTADAAGWYQNADPGPKHPCKSGTTPGPLASSVFDNDTTQNNSILSPFNLTPSTSYSCQSQSGTGQLTWDASNKLLTISGVVFIDGGVTVTQSARYSGKGTIYVGGQFSFTGQTTTLCAVQYCFFSQWNPNTTMLMIVALGAGTAIDIGGNNNVFQGSLFTNPTSTIAFTGNNAWVQGPVVGGKFSWGNNVIIQPMPTINTLPPGAPLATNAHATPGPLVYANG
jgi:Tfp pilus assembly protein PilX